MVNNNIITSVKFEHYITEIFKKSGYSVSTGVKYTIKESNGEKIYSIVDIIAELDEAKYCIEIKYNAAKNLESLVKYKNSIENICLIAREKGMIPVLICSSIILPQTREKCQSDYPDLILLDIKNLLFSLRDISGARNELVSLLSYSTDDIEPEAHSISLGWIQHCDSYNDLIIKFEKCPSGKEYSTQYEELCTEMLIAALADDLDLWTKQQCSNDGLYRFDLICRIKDDTKKTFWSIIENYFNSKYVIFEFKNYEKAITQKEIYTTEKYLYKRALRCVAIIIAKNGSDINSIWAAKGCLRETGKLIILLDNNDLIKMVQAKMNEEDSSLILLNKLDSLLSELEK